MTTKCRVVLLLSTLFIFGCERMETIESSYPDVASAKAAGAIGQGKWIPDSIPGGASNIREAHNLDTNEVWLSFRATPNEGQAFVRSCKEVVGDKVTYARKSPSSWWPGVLARGSNASNEKVFSYYDCGRRSWVAIDRGSNQIYFWANGA